MQVNMHLRDDLVASIDAYWRAAGAPSRTAWIVGLLERELSVPTRLPPVSAAKLAIGDLRRLANSAPLASPAPPVTARETMWSLPVADVFDSLRNRHMETLDELAELHAAYTALHADYTRLRDDLRRALVVLETPVVTNAFVRAAQGGDRD